MSHNYHAIAAFAHRGRILALIGVAAAGGLAAFGIWSRSDTVATLKQEADDAAIPRVQVVSPKPGPPSRTLALPGNIAAWYEAPIYAQVTGYVAHWFKDYGALVKSGDILATTRVSSRNRRRATWISFPRDRRCAAACTRRNSDRSRAR